MATKTGTIALVSRTLYWRMTINEDSYDVANNTSTLSYAFEYYMSAGSGGWADGNSIMFQLGINGYTSLFNVFYINGTLQTSIQNKKTYTNQAGTYKFNYLGGGSTYRTAKMCPIGQSGENADVSAETRGTVTFTHNADGTGTAYLQARFGMYGTGAAATRGSIKTMTSDTITLTDLRKTATVSAGTGATISPTTSSYQVNLNGSYTVSGNKLTLPIGNGTSSITASAQTGYNTPTWNRASGTMSSDLTFTASATKLTYSVTYNKGDATSGTAPSAQTKTYGTDLTLATNSGNLSKSNTTHSNNKTGQAITLSYNANGGTGAPSNNTGTGVTVPGTFTRSYTFDGWGTSSGTETVAYSAGASYTANAAVTLYPAWKHTDGSTTYTATSASATISSTKPTKANTDTNVTITVSYDANGGSSTPGNSTGTAVNTTPHPFSQWAAGSTSGTKYNAGATYTESITASKTVTMYAIYGDGTTTRKSNPSITTASSIARANGSTSGYSVSYDMAGGTGGPSTQTSGNRQITYSFKQWNTNSSGTGTAYNSSTSYSFSSDTKLYAIWNSTTSSSSSWTCPTTTPTKSGFDFVGWSTVSTDTTPMFLPGQTYTITSNQKLYAIWKASGSVRVFTGSEYKYGKPHVRIGSAWVPGTAYVYNGTSWKKGV